MPIGIQNILLLRKIRMDVLFLSGSCKNSLTACIEKYKDVDYVFKQLTLTPQNL